MTPTAYSFMAYVALLALLAIVSPLAWAIFDPAMADDWYDEVSK